MITRRGMLGGGAAALALAARRAYASHRVTLLVGTSLGTAPDIVARGFIPFLERHLDGVEIAIRNVSGDSGMAAFQALAAAPASGNTLGWVATPTLPARLVDRDDTTLMPRLSLLGAVQKEPIAFVSPTATPLETVQDIVRRSGEDADAVPLGTPPPGSPPHLAVLKLQALVRTRLNIVTFPSSAAARQAVVAGNVAAAALGMANVIADLREGRLSGLGIAAKARAGAFPDMPALNEAGLPLSAVITRGVALPAGVPEELQAQFAAALQAVTTDPEFREQAEESGFLVSWIDGTTWTALVEAERLRLAALWATDPWLQAGGQ